VVVCILLQYSIYTIHYPIKDNKKPLSSFDRGLSGGGGVQMVNIYNTVKGLIQVAKTAYLYYSL
jgi:hypothetical protein